MYIYRKKSVLYVVISCYNEEEVLPITAPIFREKLDSLSERELILEDTKILFVNDGSKDRTWEVLTNLCDLDPMFCSIKSFQKSWTPERTPYRTHGSQGIC